MIRDDWSWSLLCNFDIWIFQLHTCTIHFPHPPPFGPIDKINIFINLDFVFKVTSWDDSGWMCVEPEEGLYGANDTGKVRSFAAGAATRC